MPSSPDYYDLEKRRQVTRELNEATKDARTVMRGLREARALIDAEIEKTIETLVNARIAELNEALNARAAELQTVIDEYNREIRDHFSRLLGAGEPAQLLGMLAQQMTPVVADMLNESFGQALNQIAGTIARSAPTVNAKARVDMPIPPEWK